MSDLRFSDFLETIENANKDFVAEINTFLLTKGCKHNIKVAKRGLTVSYIFGRTKRTLATFICRKSGVKLRIYPQQLSKYEELLNSFPDNMKKDIKKASVCKRLIDSNACNPKCVMGYDFHLDDEHYQKCRYMAFQPTLNQENNPYIRLFLEKEIS